MAPKVTDYNAEDVRSLTPAASERDALLQGVLVAIVGGEAVRADYRASQGPRPARGFITQSVQRLSGPIPAVSGYEARIPYAREAIVAGWSGAGLLLKGQVGLTMGATYYLNTGGGITVVPVDTATNDVRQVVGYAETDDILVGCVGSPILHA